MGEATSPARLIHSFAGTTRGSVAVLPVRVVRRAVAGKEGRLRGVTLVTTLLDLKTSLGLETLRGKGPDMARKELCAGSIAHNLIRCTMVESASQHEVPVERISFQGSLDALRHTSQAMATVGGRRRKLELWVGLLATLARDLVPERPWRREPRAVKRRRNKYPRLSVARRKFRDRPKRNTRRKLGFLRVKSPGQVPFPLSGDGGLGAGFCRRRVAVPLREGAEPQEGVRGRAAKG